MLLSQLNRITLLVVLLIFFTSIYAAIYNFNQFSGYAKQRYGEDAYKDTLELQGLIKSLQSAPETEKLKKINNFFNYKVNFAEDIDLWGQLDYWATPLEIIGRSAGDCEDYSIAKYTFLKILNVPNDKLRLTYVRAETTNQDRRVVLAHMVLSYYETPQSDPLTLDNLVPKIMPASARKDLTPVYSFNSNDLWVGAINVSKGGSMSHLSRWRDVIARIKADGIFN